VPATAATTPQSAPTTVSASSPAPTSSPMPAGPGTSTPPSPSPSPVAAGTLTVTPPGGPLIVRSGGRKLLLLATGGTVDWSATIANDPGNAISLSQSSGTLTAASTTATVTVTASQFVPCVASSYPTITISPSGTQYIVCTGFIKPLTRPGHRRGHRRDDPFAPGTPTTPGLAMSALARQREQ
jgi:hypothetical protein